MKFSERVKRLSQMEDEILEKSSGLMKNGTPAYISDLFIIGAVKRALSLSSGFRRLISDGNFTCCAGLLRMQIDTAARINSLRYVNDRDALCQAVIAGERFDKQKSSDGKRLNDSYIIGKLAEENSWVASVYKETSGFIHLSERHLFSSITKTDDESRAVTFSVSATEQKRPEEDYYEILDAFLEATKMTGTLVLGYMMSRNMSKTV